MVRAHGKHCGGSGRLCWKINLGGWSVCPFREVYLIKTFRLTLTLSGGPLHLLHSPRQTSGKDQVKGRRDMKPSTCIKTSGYVCYRSLCPSTSTKINFISSILPPPGHRHADQCTCVADKFWHKTKPTLWRQNSTVRSIQISQQSRERRHKEKFLSFLRSMKFC